MKFSIVAFRLLMIGFAFLGSSVRADELQNTCEVEWEDGFIEQIQEGFETLLAGDPWNAEAKFAKLAIDLKQFPEEEYGTSSRMFSFYLSCGQAVAFNCLGLNKECGSACNEMLRCILTISEEDEEEEEDVTPEEEEKEYQFYNVMTKAIYLAPSIAVRDLLLFLIDPSEMALEELLHYLPSME